MINLQAEKVKEASALVEVNARSAAANGILQISVHCSQIQDPQEDNDHRQRTAAPKQSDLKMRKNTGIEKDLGDLHYDRGMAKDRDMIDDHEHRDISPDEVKDDAQWARVISDRSTSRANEKE